MHYHSDNNSNNLHNISDEEDDLGFEEEEENSFEQQNTLFELKSQNNALQIQLRKMKMTMESSSAEK